MSLKTRIQFRFYGRLNDFLKPEKRQTTLSVRYRQPRSIKDAIESLGIPHVEIGLVVIDKEIVSDGQCLGGGERIAVYPHSELTEEPPQKPLSFQVDENMGKLAKWLRLIGFDAKYEKSLLDDEVVLRAETENRILLSRDVGLLKRRALSRGYFVRSTQPHEQLIEVIERFGLSKHARPFSRCLMCNGTLQFATKNAILDQIPDGIGATVEAYKQCHRCDKVYWRGSHYSRLSQFLDKLPIGWTGVGSGLSRQ